MPKSKKRTYGRRKTIKCKPKRSKKAGMHEPDLSFFTDYTDAKNSMIGVNTVPRLNWYKEGLEEDINDLEENVALIKAYLRYNKNRQRKLMPSKIVKETLRGKYVGKEATPGREAERYYDLLENQYELNKDYLERSKYKLKRVNGYLKFIKKYHKHSKKYEESIGVYKPEAPTGNF